MEKKDFMLYIHDDKKYADLSLYECGYEKCVGGHSFGPSVRQFYLLHFVIKGKGIYHINHHTYSVQSNMCFMIPPGEETTYIADIDDPWEYYWIGIHGLEAKEILKQASLYYGKYVVDLNESEKVFNILEKLTLCEKRQASSKFFVMGYLYQIIGLLVKGNPENYVEIKPKSDELVQQFIRYVEENYSNHISITEFTEKNDIDRTIFSKMFKKTLDISPQNYIVNYRLSKSLVLLKDKRYTVLDVSTMVGFHDYKHFLKTFKSTYTITPKAYRKDPFENS